MCDFIHKWEAAGLGKAPFRLVRCERRVGPIRTEVNGVTMECGSPGQPMGTCDYCGTGIADCFVIRSTDGKEFIVGCECVRRTHSKGDKVLTDVQREVNKMRTAARHAREDAKIAVGLNRLAELRPSLTTKPHPNKYFAEKGKTLADYCDFMFKNSGRKGQLGMTKWLEQIS